EPVRRHERESPGELIHIDIWKLGCFTKVSHRICGCFPSHPNREGLGWEFVHGCATVCNTSARDAIRQGQTEKRGASSRRCLYQPTPEATKPRIAGGRATDLAAPLQLAQATCQPEGADTDQPIRYDPRQPPVTPWRGA